jgi:predicted Zn-dependent peptidase
MNHRPPTAALVLLLAAAAALPAAAEKAAPLPADLPPFAADKPLPVPDLTATRLGNGLTVWIVPRSGQPKLTAILAVRGGTAVDPPGLGGMAEVLAAVVKEGTARRSSREIAEELQAAGGDITTAVDDDLVRVRVDGFSTAADRLLDVLADIATAATFPPAEVELEKANALQNLALQESTPDFAVDKVFGHAVFGDHPYHLVAPTAAALEAVTPELLRAEYARRFRPDRSLLVIVGAIEADRARALAEAKLGGWRGRGEAPPPVPAAPSASRPAILLVPRAGAVQSEIRVGRPAVLATDPDFYPLLVANTVFGGAFASRLVENIREEKGYTYSPGSSVDTMAAGGLLTVAAAVRNEVTAAALLEIHYELDRMATTLPEAEELARAKRYQTGLYLLRNQIQGAVAATLVGYWMRGLPPEELAAFVPKVEAVTAEQVREVSVRHLASRSQTVVVGGDVDAVRGGVEVFGPATVVTP